MSKLDKQKKQYIILGVLVFLIVVVGYSTFTGDEEYSGDAGAFDSAASQSSPVGKTGAGQVSPAEPVNAPVKRQFEPNLQALIDEIVVNSPNQREGFLSLATKESARLAELAASVAQQQAIASKALLEKETNDYELERMRARRQAEAAERERISKAQAVTSMPANLPVANVDYSQLVGGGSQSSQRQQVTQITEPVKPPVKKKVDWEPANFEVRGIVTTESGLMAMVHYKGVKHNLVKGSRLHTGEIVVRDVLPGEIVLDVDGERESVFFNL